MLIKTIMLGEHAVKNWCSRPHICPKDLVNKLRIQLQGRKGSSIQGSKGGGGAE